VLGSSSGFQSAQFREFEYRLGLKDGGHLRFQEEGSGLYSDLHCALHEPSLWDEANAAAARAGLDLPADVIDGLVAETVEHAVRVHGEAAALARLEEATGVPRLELPQFVEGVDLGSLYELAEALMEQGAGAPVLSELGS
jgi:tryptophan 2,3-dioxygenase